MKQVIITILALAAALLPHHAPGADRPNVLMIAIDDQNDWIGCLGGHPQAKTPNIDALAKRGTVFTNAHCQSPLCNPSRTSLMLSRRPGATGIYGLAPWFRDVPALADSVTLPQWFAKHGNHYTATAGKIYHGRYGRKNTPKHKEWDEAGPGASGKPFPPKKLVNTPQPHKLVDWGTFPHKDEDKGDYIVADWAVDRLGNHRELTENGKRPFFMAVGFFLPHVPCYATQKWMDMHPLEGLKLPEVIANDRADTPRFSWNLHWKLPEPRLKFLKEAGEWENLTRSYLACTTFVDAQVGRVLKALEESGHADNTIIVLWSDHGWHIGEKEITGKNTLWDDGTRVPLIFAGQGVTKGQVCRKPAELLDIYPTLVELTGLPANEAVEGHSLVPQLKDAGADRPWPAITTHNHDNHGVRTENWRYIRYADGSEELYNMKEDPNEWHNLLALDTGAPDPTARRKADALAKWLPKENVPPAPKSAARILTYDKETKETIWEGKPITPGDPIPEL
ncbi:MAG: sulfatase [Akkermansiaceae bacterium]|nr:sulfatase [Akkermansiaceae bacterium]